MDRRRKVELFEQIRREYRFGVGAIQGVAKKLGVHRRMVRQALASAIPPERKIPARTKPRLGPVIEFIDEILRADQQAPRKQRHTAHRIWERVRQERPGGPWRNKVGARWLFCLTVAPFTPGEPAPEISDLLRRIAALLAAGGDVLLFRQPELYHMTALVNRHTSVPVRFVAGLSLMIRASEDVYGNLEGRRLEALARLFAQNVRIYVYPMTATDLREWLKSVSVTGWEWSETNGWVSASQLRCTRSSKRG